MRILGLSLLFGTLIMEILKYSKKAVGFLIMELFNMDARSLEFS